MRKLYLVQALVLFLVAGLAFAGPKGKTPPGTPAKHSVSKHTKAYKPRPERGQHMNIKITPPEKRGRQQRVLVEVYNYSKTYLNVVDFYIIMHTSRGERIEARIQVDDIRPRWGDLAWVKIPGTGKIPPITRVHVEKMQIFDKNGKRVKLKYYTDLIKE